MRWTDRRSLLAPTALVVAAVVPAPIVVAAQYLTIDAAQRALFPLAERFDESPVALTAQQWQEVARAAGPQAGHGALHLWIARNHDSVAGYVFVDEVIGRSDFITYAVGVDPDGKLRPVEVMEYRESHGGEIRNPRWLAQFAGRSEARQLTFGTDIKNIAGATLSSEHVTAGVRRILGIWQVLFAHAATPGAPAR